MNATERIMKTLEHEEPDRVPAFESTFTNDTIMKEYGIKPPRLGPVLGILRLIPFGNRIMSYAASKRSLVRQGFLSLARFYKKAGLDLIPTITALFPKKLVKGGFIDEFGRHMQFEYYEKDGTEIIGYNSGYFKDFDDYCSWELPDPAWPGRINNFLAGLDIEEELDHEIMTVPGLTGMMEVTWECFGIENFSRLLARKKHARKVFDDRGKFTVELVKILAENGARLALIFDDYGFKNGLFMSPRNYREYVFPWLKRACKTAHERGCKIMLHSDGDLTAILDDLVNDCGIDALNPIEPTTANPEYTIFNLKEKYGDKITLVGNVSPIMLATGTIDEIKDYTARLMREVAPGGGFILASGHSINPAVTLDRWRAMMDTRDKLGVYPIRDAS